MNPDLRDFLALVKKEDPCNVLEISNPVDPKYEITAYALELEKQGRFPVLVFPKVKNHNYTVVTNTFGLRRRYSLALGVQDEHIIHEWIKRSKIEIDPIEVKDPPVKSCISAGNELNLYSLPILTHFSQDAGPYVTSGIIIAKHPQTGVRNASLHRLQLKGKNKFGVSLHSHRHLWEYQRIAEKEGKPLEIAIVIGAHPLFYFGAGLWRGSIETDEFRIAGGFIGEPLEITRCETCDLEVPANAEIVLEGRILPLVREDEGPFGEFTGYASRNSTRHVVEITGILQRKDAIYQDIVSGFSAEHNSLIGIPHEAQIFESVKSSVPSIKKVCFPWSGACRLHCYISMDKAVEGQPKTAIFSAFANDLGLKLVVVVDSDIDVFNDKEVLWAISTRLQWDKGVFMVPNCLGSLLDPSSKDGLTAKVGIDATIPLTGWQAEKCTLPEDLSAKIKEILKNLQ